MATHLLGIMGKKRSGKDTLAALLVEHHGFTRVSLADPLREAALGLDPYLVSTMLDGDGRTWRPLRLSDALAAWGGWEGVKRSPYADEIRRTLQRFGTEAVRDVLGPQTWANEMLRRAAAIDGPVVVPDVRFPEEYRAIAEWEAGYDGESGVLVRVVGRGVLDDPHPSETALDGYPAEMEIDNSGPLAWTHVLADDLAEYVLA